MYKCKIFTTCSKEKMCKIINLTGFPTALSQKYLNFPGKKLVIQNHPYYGENWGLHFFSIICIFFGKYQR